MKPITEYLINNHIHKYNPIAHKNDYKKITKKDCKNSLCDCAYDEKPLFIEKFICDTYNVEEIDTETMLNFVKDYYGMFLTFDFDDTEMKDMQEKINKTNANDMSFESVLNRVQCMKKIDINYVVRNIWPDFFNGFILKIIEMEK